MKACSEVLPAAGWAGAGCRRPTIRVHREGNSRSTGSSSEFRDGTQELGTGSGWSGILEIPGGLGFNRTGAGMGAGIGTEIEAGVGARIGIGAGMRMGMGHRIGIGMGIAHSTPGRAPASSWARKAPPTPPSPAHHSTLSQWEASGGAGQAAAAPPPSAPQPIDSAERSAGSADWPGQRGC